MLFPQFAWELALPSTLLPVVDVGPIHLEGRAGIRCERVCIKIVKNGRIKWFGDLDVCSDR